MKVFWIAIGFAAGLLFSAVVADAARDRDGREREILVDKYGRVYVADDTRWDDIKYRLERIERALAKKGIQ